VRLGTHSAPRTLPKTRALALRLLDPLPPPLLSGDVRTRERERPLRNALLDPTIGLLGLSSARLWPSRSAHGTRRAQVLERLQASGAQSRPASWHVDMPQGHVRGVAGALASFRMPGVLT